MARIRSRTLVLLVALSGVAALLAAPARAEVGVAAASGAGVAIVSPTDKSQLPAAGNGTVLVELHDGLETSSLRVVLLNTTTGRTVDLTDRLIKGQLSATASFGPSDLAPGITRVERDGESRPRQHRRPRSQRVLVGARHRCHRRRPLRAAGPGPLPAAVPERPLHGPRCEHRHRPAGRLQPRVDAGQHRGRAHRPDRVEPQRRLQPRRHDRRPRARPRPGARPAPRRSPTSPARSMPTRRSCSSTPRPASAGRSSPSSIRPRPPTRRPRAHHPPGAQPDRGSPLHRRPAPPEERRRRDHRAQPRVPRSTATTSPPSSPRSSSGAATSSSSSATLRHAASGDADLYLAWDFTVASERNLPGACCTSATTRSRRSTAARRRSRSTAVENDVSTDRSSAG